LLKDDTQNIGSIKESVLNCLQQCATNSDLVAQFISSDSELIQKIVGILKDNHGSEKEKIICFGILGAVLSAEIGVAIVQELMKMDLDCILFDAILSLRDEENKMTCLKYFLWILSNASMEVTDN